MSYEGYEVKYCGNGHKKAVVDALTTMYDPEEVKPCFCGSDKEYWDSVDETNGCSCEDTDRPQEYQCPCHEKVTKILGYTMIPCRQCNGSGTVPDVFEEKCCGTADCRLCFGTGTKYVDSSCNINRKCPNCLGRGTYPVPIYDIAVLKERHS